MEVILFLLPLDNPAALYGILLVFIFVSAFGVPIPEEVTLLLAGYLAYLGFIHFWATVVLMSLSIALADFCGYLLGRYAGDFVYERVLGKFQFTRDLLVKGKRYTDRFGEKVVLLTRPISGVRFVVPIMMGHFRMNAKKFFLYDLAAAVPYTIIIVALSYYLGSVVALAGDIEAAKKVIVWVVVGCLAIWFLMRYVRKGK